MLCAVSMADGCGDEPTLIATYGDEIGRLVRRHMPTIMLERGSRALPVDFRRCRATACGDGTPRGLVHLTDEGQHVTAFVHVVDCRAGPGAEPRRRRDAARLLRSPRRLSLYRVLALLRRLGDPARRADRRGRGLSPRRLGIGRHPHRPGRRVDERASSHHGYNYAQSVANAGSDVGSDTLREAAEAVGARPHGGWGPETRLLLVSGGSHAGNAAGFLGNVDRIVPGRRVHLVPLEPVAAAEGDAYRFVVTPTLAQEGLARPRGHRDELSRVDCCLVPTPVGKMQQLTSAACAGRRRGGSSRR